MTKPKPKPTPAPIPKPTPAARPAPATPTVRRERTIAELSDSEILKLSGHGKYGPGIVGEEIHQRSVAILKGSAGGKLGRAIVEHDFAATELVGRGHPPVSPTPTAEAPGAEPEPTGPIDPTDLKDPRNPWTYVTLSGAKQLAMKAGVSHIPKVTRRDLIAQLQGAGVVPPPAPDAEDLRKDDERDARDRASEI